VALAKINGKFMRLEFMNQIERVMHASIKISTSSRDQVINLRIVLNKMQKQSKLLNFMLEICST